MRMSPPSRWGIRSAMLLSTTAAGTISQIARGFLSLPTRSASEAAPTAFSRARSATAFGDMSKTTHSWPPLIRRRTMLAPIRPNPIIASCMTSFSVNAEPHPAAVHGGGDVFAVVENRRARHQHIRAGGDRPRRRSRVDPSIHLEAARRLDALDDLARARNLRQRRREEMLVSEARVHRHDQYLVDVRHDVLEHTRGRNRPRGSRAPVSLRLSYWSSLFRSCGTGMSFFKSVYKLPIAAGHLSHPGLSRRLLVPPEHKRLPQIPPPPRRTP